MTTGYFKIGDVESGAVMNLKVNYLKIISSKLCQFLEDSVTKWESLSTSMI